MVQTLHKDSPSGSGDGACRVEKHLSERVSARVCVSVWQNMALAIDGGTTPCS